MFKPERDPIYVRASVWPRCNLLCSYCPIDEGMENRVPEQLAGGLLSTDAYIRNMRFVAGSGVEGISFTGGEPTLRADLDDLIHGVRPYFDRVELTTNGRQLPRVSSAVKDCVDLLKVSLDSLDEERVRALTGRDHAFRDARRSIAWAVEAAVPLGVNVVLMRDTLGELDSIVRFVADTARQSSAPVHLSLLDFYYSPSRRQEWLQGFVPTSVVLDQMQSAFGSANVQERFGCTFYWFDVDGLPVRLKDSYSATMRATKCSGCTSYCQEGVYGVKHSAEGWLTTCPSDRPELGVHLASDLTDAELGSRIEHVLADVRFATPDDSSFQTMCESHRLRVVESSDDLPSAGVPVELTRKGV